MAGNAASSQLGTGKKLLFSIISLVMFLVVAEGLLRLWVYYVREEYERYDVATETFTLVPGEHRSFGHPIVVNSDGFVGNELVEDGPDLWRIVSIGDSNTFGGGSPIYSYPAQLEAVLKERGDPDRRYEVVNAGIQGFTSMDGLRRLRSKVLPLNPDVVTIYLGWNDLMKNDPVGQRDNHPLSTASRLVDALWLVKGMRKLVFLELRPYMDPPATGPESRTGQFTDFVPDFYIDNLKTIISEIRESGAQPLLVTLPTVVRPDMTVEDIRELRIFFPYYRSAYGVGDLLDLVAAYNRAIRRVAVEEQVPLSELDEVFAAREDYRKLFYDTMHPTTEGNGIIAEAMFEVLARDSLLGGTPSEEPPASRAAAAPTR